MAGNSVNKILGILSEVTSAVVNISLQKHVLTCYRHFYAPFTHIVLLFSVNKVNYTHKYGYYLECKLSNGWRIASSRGFDEKHRICTSAFWELDSGITC